MKFMNSNYGNDGYNYANFGGGRNRQSTSADDIPVGKPSTKAVYPAASSTIPMNPPSAESLKTLENDMLRAESKASKSSSPKRVRVREGANSNKLYRRGRVALKQAGRFVKNNKVATGLAAAGALGAVGYGVYRKMRSDKGKKRGNYR